MTDYEKRKIVKTAEIWKKSNVVEKISMIMIILLALFISVTGVIRLFVYTEWFFYYPTIQNFAVSCLLIILGIYNWRNNRVFAFLFWFSAISVFMTAYSDTPVFWRYNF